MFTKTLEGINSRLDDAERWSVNWQTEVEITEAENKKEKRGQSQRSL